MGSNGVPVAQADWASEHSAEDFKFESYGFTGERDAFTNQYACVLFSMVAKNRQLNTLHLDVARAPTRSSVAATLGSRQFVEKTFAHPPVRVVGRRRNRRVGNAHVGM